MSSGYLGSNLATHVGGQSSQTHGSYRSRGRDARRTERDVERLLRLAGTAIEVEQLRQLALLDRQLSSTLRAALGPRRLRSRLQPVFDLEGVGRRRVSRSDTRQLSQTIRTEIELAGSRVSSELWPTYCFPSSQASALRSAARRLGLPLVPIPAAFGRLGKRLGVEFVRLQVPPHALFLRAAGIGLELQGIGPTPVLAVGGFALRPQPHAFCSWLVHTQRVTSSRQEVLPSGATRPSVWALLLQALHEALATIVPGTLRDRTHGTSRSLPLSC